MLITLCQQCSVTAKFGIVVLTRHITHDGPADTKVAGDGPIFLNLCVSQLDRRQHTLRDLWWCVAGGVLCVPRPPTCGEDSVCRALSQTPESFLSRRQRHKRRQPQKAYTGRDKSANVEIVTVSGAVSDYKTNNTNKM